MCVCVIWNNLIILYIQHMHLSLICESHISYKTRALIEIIHMPDAQDTFSCDYLTEDGQLLELPLHDLNASSGQQPFLLNINETGKTHLSGMSEWHV